MDPSLRTILHDSVPFESSVTSNDLLLKHILSHLHFTDLLTSSLVNQRWRQYSRQELKRRKCLARVHGTTSTPCRQLIELSCLLKSVPAEQIPFNGLRIDEFEYHEDCIPGHRSPEAFHGVLAKAPLTHLRVYLHDYTHCLSRTFIKTLFKTRGHEIEHLVVRSCFRFGLFSVPRRFIKYFEVENKRLLNLKTLKLKSTMSKRNFTQILNEAPNLNAIWGSVQPSLIPVLVRENKVNLIQEFVFDVFMMQARGHLEPVLEFARLGPKLQYLNVYSYNFVGEPWTCQKSLEILVRLIESSADTLRKLKLGHLDLLLLSTLEIPPLLKLKKISLDYYPKLDRHLGYLSLQRINFHTLFPALQSVKILSTVHHSPRSFLNVPESLRLLLNEISSRGIYSCRSVRNLKLSLEGVNISKMGSDPLAAITNLFPAITSISFGKTRYLKPSLVLVLESKWPLESLALECSQQSRKALKEIHALLCGISLEERAYLASFDPVSLHKFHLVPFEHSLLHFTNLRILKIIVKDAGGSAPWKSMDATMNSHITRGLVLSKIPGLKVDIC